MAKWGKCDYRTLEQTARRLERAARRESGQACRETAQTIGQMLLNKAKKRTPVGVVPNVSGDAHKHWEGYRGGALRDGWTVLPLEKHGDRYEVTVLNPMEYASYVEYGHRQTPGRYVPALGKSLKVSWVPGKWMLTSAEQEVREVVPKLLEGAMYQALKGVLDGDK